jgi:hypothetical protein
MIKNEYLYAARESIRLEDEEAGQRFIKETEEARIAEEKRVADEQARLKAVAKKREEEFEAFQESQRQARIKAERDRLIAEQAERDRLARIIAEQAERDRLARLIAEQAERDRLARIKAQQDRLKALVPAPAFSVALDPQAAQAAQVAPARTCRYGLGCVNQARCQFLHHVKPQHVQLFHVTNFAAAEAIWTQFIKQQEKGGLNPSKSGSVGPGVYFCLRPSDCAIKALKLHDPSTGDLSKESVIISVQVPIDDIKVIGYSAASCEEDVLYLRGETRPGPEVCIKDPSKVELIGMFRFNTDLGGTWKYHQKISFSYQRSREEDFELFNRSVTFGQMPFRGNPFNLIARDKSVGRCPGDTLKLVDYMPKCERMGCTDTSILHNLLYVHDGILWDDVDPLKLRWKTGQGEYQKEGVQPQNKHGFLGNKRTAKKRKPNRKSNRKSNRK